MLNRSLEERRKDYSPDLGAYVPLEAIPVWADFGPHLLDAASEAKKTNIERAQNDASHMASMPDSDDEELQNVKVAKKSKKVLLRRSCPLLTRFLQAKSSASKRGSSKPPVGRLLSVFNPSFNQIVCLYKGDARNVECDATCINIAGAVFGQMGLPSRDGKQRHIGEQSSEWFCLRSRHEQTCSIEEIRPTGRHGNDR